MSYVGPSGRLDGTRKEVDRKRDSDFQSGLVDIPVAVPHVQKRKVSSRVSGERTASHHVEPRRWSSWVDRRVSAQRSLTQRRVVLENRLRASGLDIPLDSEMQKNREEHQRATTQQSVRSKRSRSRQQSVRNTEVLALHALYPQVSERYTQSQTSVIEQYSNTFHEQLTIFAEFHAQSQDPEVPTDIAAYASAQLRGVLPPVLSALVLRSLPTQLLSFPCPEELLERRVVDACTTVAVLNEACEFFASMIQRLGFNLQRQLDKAKSQNTATTHIWRQLQVLIDKIGMVPLRIHLLRYLDDTVQSLNSLIETECVRQKEGPSSEVSEQKKDNSAYNTQEWKTDGVEANSSTTTVSDAGTTTTPNLYSVPSYVLLHNPPLANIDTSNVCMDVAQLVASDGFVACNISIENTLVYGIIQAGEHILEEIMQEKQLRLKRSMLTFDKSQQDLLNEPFASWTSDCKDTSDSHTATDIDKCAHVTTQKECVIVVPMVAPLSPHNKRHVVSHKGNQPEAEFLEQLCVRSVHAVDADAQKDVTIRGAIIMPAELPPRLATRANIDSSSGRKYQFPQSQKAETGMAKKDPTLMHLSLRRPSVIENVSSYVVEGNSPVFAKEKKGFYHSYPNSAANSRADQQANGGQAELPQYSNTASDNSAVVVVEPTLLGEQSRQDSSETTVLKQIAEQAAYNSIFLPSRDQSVVLTAHGGVYSSVHTINEHKKKADESLVDEKPSEISFIVDPEVCTTNGITNTARVLKTTSIEFNPSHTTDRMFTFTPSIRRKTAKSHAYADSTTSKQHTVLPLSNITRIGSYMKVPNVKHSSPSTVDLQVERQYAAEEERGERPLCNLQSIVSRPASPFQYYDHGKLVLYNDPFANADDTHELHAGVASETIKLAQTGKIESQFLRLANPSSSDLSSSLQQSSTLQQSPQQQIHNSTVLHTMLRGTLLEEKNHDTSFAPVNAVLDDEYTVSTTDQRGIPEVVVPVSTTLALYEGAPQSILNFVQSPPQPTAEEQGRFERNKYLLSMMPVTEELEEQVSVAVGETVRPQVLVPMHVEYQEPEQVIKSKHLKMTSNIYDKIHRKSRQPALPYYIRLATFNSLLHSRIQCTRKVRMKATLFFSDFMSRAHHFVENEMQAKLDAETELENPSVSKSSAEYTNSGVKVSQKAMNSNTVDVVELQRLSSSIEPPTVDMVLRKHGILKPVERSESMILLDEKSLMVRQRAQQQSAVGAAMRVLGRKGTQDELLEAYVPQNSASIDRSLAFLPPKLQQHQIKVDRSVTNGDTVIKIKGDPTHQNAQVNFSYHRDVPSTSYTNDPAVVRRRRELKYREKQINNAVAYAMEHADSIFEMQDRLKQVDNSGTLPLGAVISELEAARKPCVCGRGVQDECPCYRPPIFLEENTDQNVLLFSRVSVQQQQSNSNRVPLRSYYVERMREQDSEMPRMEATSVQRDLHSKASLTKNQAITDFSKGAPEDQSTILEDIEKDGFAGRIDSWHHHTKRKAFEARKSLHKSLVAAERARAGIQKDTVSDTVVSDAQLRRMLASSKALQPLSMDSTGKLCMQLVSTEVAPPRKAKKDNPYQAIDYELLRVPDRLDRMRNHTTDIASFAHAALTRMDQINTKSEVPALPPVAVCRKKTNNGIYVRHADLEYLVKSQGYDKRRY